MSRIQPALSVICALLSLAKIRIVMLVLVACAIAFILAEHADIPLRKLFWTLLGTGLVSAGACALNCYLEWQTDALMPRTCRRPIPRGTIQPRTALVFAVTLVVAGTFALAAQANAAAAALGALAAFIYIGVYTPAKRVTWLNTPIGALPGAIPALIGWVAARGHLEAGAWILFAMLFFWQHVHFFPIAWLFRSDYETVGFRMLPVLERSPKKTFVLTLVAAVALFLSSLLLYKINVAGCAYCFAVIALGAILIAAGMRLSRNPTRAAARAVLIACLFYFPVILATVMLDRFCFGAR